MSIRILAMGVLFIAFSGLSEAALVLTVDSYTNDELSFSISGAFDADTIGDLPGYLAIKNDWSNNVGTHTELFSSAPTITSNTITIGGGFFVTNTTVQNGSAPWTDNVFFTLTDISGNDFTGFPFTAGMPVSGSMTLSGVGAFDPADAATLELVSGFNRGSDYARLEFSPVPIPAALPLFVSGLLGLIGLSRRKKAA